MFCLKKIIFAKLVLIFKEKSTIFPATENYKILSGFIKMLLFCRYCTKIKIRNFNYHLSRLNELCAVQFRQFGGKNLGLTLTEFPKKSESEPLCPAPHS